MVLMAAKDFIRLQIQIHIFPVRTFQKLNVDQFEGDLACLEENVQGSRWLAQQIGVQFQRHFFFQFRVDGSRSVSGVWSNHEYRFVTLTIVSKNPPVSLTLPEVLLF